MGGKPLVHAPLLQCQLATIYIAVYIANCRHLKSREKLLIWTIQYTWFKFKGSQCFDVTDNWLRPMHTQIFSCTKVIKHLEVAKSFALVQHSIFCTPLTVGRSFTVGMSSDPWQWECPQIPGRGNVLRSLAVGMPSRPWQRGRPIASRGSVDKKRHRGK